MNSGLKNESLLQKIQQSGSLSLKPRNSVGLHLFDDKDLEDGVISQPLRKPKYNLQSLKESIDISITELLDDVVVEAPETVLREVYNEAIDRITELTDELEELQSQNSSLQSTISNLQSEIQNLQSLNDNLELLKSISDNQLDVITDRLTTSIEDLQAAIQKSIAEAIQRSSLQSRNELLISENNSLKEQLFGRQAQIEAGAISSGTLFTVRALDVVNPLEPPVYATQKYKGGRLGAKTDNYEISIRNGERLEVFNATTKPITVRASLNRDVSDNADQWINKIDDIQIEPGSKKIIKLSTDKNWKRNRKNKTYSGSITFFASLDGISEQVNIPTKIKRYR